MVKSASLTLCLLALSLSAWASSLVTGKVVDAHTKEPLAGVSINVKDATSGAISNHDGSFAIKVKEGAATLQLRYLGYEEKLVAITVNANRDMGDVGMEPAYFGLEDIIIIGSVATDRKTPVAVSVISPDEIENKLSNQEFPEIMKSTPGVYATRVGGGYGDGRVNLRGFESANVAVMVNGVPVNDMEWGGVYWSNWMGVADVTLSMQTQRGLGASKVSGPSVGGSINIITQSTNVEPGGSLSYAMGNDGYNKISFNVSTGQKNGWAMTLLGSKNWGDGYIQGTASEGYAYFANISKVLNEHHSLSFTAMGAPQWHNQRNQYDKLLISEWQKQPDKYRYNPVYGFGVNGQYKTSMQNSYHKPQISLKHFWRIDEHSSLSTVLYTSIGRGYGTSGQGATKADWYGAISATGKPNMKFRAADGTYDYSAIYALNQSSANGSQLVMSNSENHHNWYGLISTYTSKIGQYIDVYGGVDMRYYQGIHTNRITDLYGGAYYIDPNRMYVTYQKNNPEWQNEKLQVGDVVYRDYDSQIIQAGAFGQAEFSRNDISAFISGSISNNNYSRYDRFYYSKDEAQSDKLNFIGYTIKGGANYNLTRIHNVFANIGYISRAPFFSGGAFLQSTTSNVTNPDAINEAVFSMEAGYGLRAGMLSANLNLYRTAWLNKTTTMSLTFANGSRGSLNMGGVDALHQGVELDLLFRPWSRLDIKGMVSLGDWKWNSNTTGYYYNDNGQAVDKDGKPVPVGSPDQGHSTLNLKGIHVGNAAQWVASLGAKLKVMNDMLLGAEYTYYTHNYANYTVAATMNSTTNYQDPWQIPASGVVDIFANYSFPMGKLRATISGNVNNLLNQEYITDADDGQDHTWQSAKVFYGFGRTFSVRLKISF